MIKIINTFFFIAILVVLFILVTSRVGIINNIRSFTVITGSMQPKIQVGSIVFTQKTNDYKKGDIIAFKKDQIAITHRIVNVKTKNNVNFYITRGDANNTSDSGFVLQNNIFGKEFLVIPYIGKFILFLKTIPGFILFVIIPTIIFIGFELKTLKNEFEKEIEKKLLKKMQTV